MRTLLPVLLFIVVSCRPAPKTTADSCYNLSDALCDKSAECGTLQTSEGQCRSELTSVCCANTDCAKTPNAAQVQFAFDCEDAFRARSCADQAAGIQPAACTHQ